MPPTKSGTRCWRASRPRSWWSGSPRRPRSARRSPRRASGCWRTCARPPAARPGGSTTSSSGCFRKARRKAPRAQRPIYAGGGTRLLAIAMDAAVLSGILLLIAAVVSALVNAFLSLDDENTALTLVFGALAWWIAAGIYLGLFWILAERTPGMTFFALRISSESGGRVRPATGHPPADRVRARSDPVRTRLSRDPHQRTPARLARPLRRHGRALRRPRDRQGHPGLHPASRAALPLTPPPERRYR